MVAKPKNPTPSVSFRDGVCASVAETLSLTFKKLALAGKRKTIYIQEADVTVKRESIDAYHLTLHGYHETYCRRRTLFDVADVLLSQAAFIGNIERIPR